MIVLAAGIAAGCFLDNYIRRFLKRKTGKKEAKYVSSVSLAIKITNGVLWVATFVFCGWSADTALSCFAVSVLLAVGVVDWYTFEIPFRLNLCLAAAGFLRIMLPAARWQTAVLGLTAAVFLLFVYWVTKGRGIGGGDIKLMAAAGLYLGFSDSIAAFWFGCVYACVIHLARMRLANAGRIFALGPYLAAGIVTAIWFGGHIVRWYAGIFL